MYQLKILDLNSAETTVLLPGNCNCNKIVMSGENILKLEGKGWSIEEVRYSNCTDASNINRLTVIIGREDKR